MKSPAALKAGHRFAVRVLTGCQKTVHGAHDSNRAAFPGLLDDGLCHMHLLLSR